MTPRTFKRSREKELRTVKRSREKEPRAVKDEEGGSPGPLKTKREEDRYTQQEVPGWCIYPTQYPAPRTVWYVPASQPVYTARPTTSLITDRSMWQRNRCCQRTFGTLFRF